MRVKRDARLLINQRRMKKNININKRVSLGVIDARKILNSKKGGGLAKGNYSMTQTASSSRNVQKPFTKKANFSNLTRIIPSKSLSGTSIGPQKRVKLAEDGNILVTAKSKIIPKSEIPAFKKPVPTVPRWTPSDVDTVDVEHVGIDDVLNMDTLPDATIDLSNKLQRRIPQRSLIEEIVDNSSTMIADQVESNKQNLNVVVSNLHASVSQLDIMELFGDVGAIKRAQRVDPGVALIEFFDPTDAFKACDLYHNRLLDGQPMQCYVQPPSPQRSFISQRLGERIGNESSLPRVTTSSSNSRCVVNPRNVRFTVKLT